MFVPVILINFENNNMTISSHILPPRIATYTLPAVGDVRGKLLPLEALSSYVPFEVKRLYLVYDVTMARGDHAHQTLKQVLLCVHGSCVVHCDVGDGRETCYKLDTLEKCLYLEGLIWRRMTDFTPGAVFLVLASEHYDLTKELEIRHYAQFLEVVKELRRQQGLEV